MIDFDLHQGQVLQRPACWRKLMLILHTLARRSLAHSDMPLTDGGMMEVAEIVPAKYRKP